MEEKQEGQYTNTLYNIHYTLYTNSLYADLDDKYLSGSIYVDVLRQPQHSVWRAPCPRPQSLKRWEPSTVPGGRVVHPQSQNWWEPSTAPRGHCAHVHKALIKLIVDHVHGSTLSIVGLLVIPCHITSSYSITNILHILHRGVVQCLCHAYSGVCALQFVTKSV